MAPLAISIFPHNVSSGPRSGLVSQENNRPKPSQQQVFPDFLARFTVSQILADVFRQRRRNGGDAAIRSCFLRVAPDKRRRVASLTRQRPGLQTSPTRRRPGDTETRRRGAELAKFSASEKSKLLRSCFCCEQRGPFLSN